MTAAALIREVQSLGIDLQPNGATLRFRPRHKVTPDLLARLQAHKSELLRLLSSGPTGADAGPAGDHGAAPPGPQDIPPAADRRDLPPEPDAADWTAYRTPDGRCGWQRSDLAGCEIVDLQPCPTCGGLERWQDLAGGWHCEQCEPRTAGPRLRELAARLRARYTAR